MSDPSAQEGMGMEVNPLWGSGDPFAQEGMGMEENPLWGSGLENPLNRIDEEEDEVELEEREAPPDPPVNPVYDPGSRLLGGFGAVSVVSVYWCICVLVYCIVKYSI